MSSISFDPNAFLDLPIDQPLERRPPLPPGDYTAQVLTVSARRWESKDKVDERTGQLKSGVAYDVEVELQISEATRDLCRLNSPTFRMKTGIMLDLNEQGGIDTSPGRNGQLMRWREALDMNKAGQTFRASAMVGKLLKVRLGHEEYPAGSGQLMEKISGVARV